MTGPVLAIARSAVPCQKCYPFPLEPPHHPHVLLKAGHRSCPACNICCRPLKFRFTQETSLCISLRLPEILQYSFSKDFKPLCLSWLWNQQIVILFVLNANIFLVFNSEERFSYSLGSKLMFSFNTFTPGGWIPTDPWARSRKKDRRADLVLSLKSK